MKASSLIGHTAEILDALVGPRSDQASSTVPPADAFIDDFFRKRRYLGARDRRLIAEAAYGVLRHLRRLKSIVETARGTDEAIARDIDEVSMLVCAYLVLLSHRDGENGGWGTIDLTEAMPEAFVESLRHAADELSLSMTHLPSPGRLGLEYSFQDWMVREFVEAFGSSEAESILASLNEQAPTTIRVNTLKCTREKCRQELESEGVPTTLTALSPFGLALQKRHALSVLSSFKRGWYEVQDEGSQLIPLAIALQSSTDVLDACAGAGGKTLEIAMLQGDTGRITATDIHSGRLGQLRERARRAGASSIRIIPSNEFERQKETMIGRFDVVLVDAPCSGTGTIRRNPGMKWSVTEAGVQNFFRAQLNILETTSSFVRREGQLVYSTCSLLKDENERVVDEFLSLHAEFVQGETAAPLRDLGRADMFRGPHVTLLPHLHGTDGFFCTVLKKTS